MVVSTMRFYEDLVQKIYSGEKSQTIRYDWSEIPEDGSILNAVSTQEGDVFAKIQIESTEVISVEECADRNLEGHKNYSSTEGLLDEMSTYYPDITREDDVILFHFSLTEWLRD